MQSIETLIKYNLFPLDGIHYDFIVKQEQLHSLIIKSSSCMFLVSHYLFSHVLLQCNCLHKLAADLSDCFSQTVCSDFPHIFFWSVLVTQATAAYPKIALGFVL